MIGLYTLATCAPLAWLSYLAGRKIEKDQQAFRRATLARFDRMLADSDPAREARAAERTQWLNDFAAECASVIDLRDEQ